MKRITAATVVLLIALLLISCTPQDNDARVDTYAGDFNEDIFYIGEFEYKGMPCLWVYYGGYLSRGGPTCDWSKWKGAGE